MRTNRRAFSIVELLVVVAIVSAISSTVFPSLGQRRSKITNKPNLEKISRAAIAYGNDFDDRIPILANGPMRSLANTRDGVLTAYGEQRTDQWPLLLLPYVKDRRVFQDPRRDDLHHIWDRAAHATQDPGYDPYGATYRNQNRHPSFGVNYVFLSPIELDEGIGGAGKTTSISKSFSQATNPAATIFYVTSTRGMVPTAEQDKVGIADKVRGFFGVNAPGMYGLSERETRMLFFTTGAACSGDWCGDVDPSSTGNQRGTNFAYIERVLKGNNVAFLDGHIKFMRDTDMTAGTNYLQATPNGDANAGGAVITDQRKYLWDLDGDYYGLYESGRGR